MKRDIQSIVWFLFDCVLCVLCECVCVQTAGARVGGAGVLEKEKTADE